MVDGPVLPIETDADVLARRRRERLLTGTQYSMEYSASGKPIQRVRNASGQLDAFGRLRVSDPHTVFDSTHRYRDNGNWNDVLVNNSGNTVVGYEANTSSVLLQVGNSSGDSTISLERANSILIHF
jgi:hypothetical protein